MMKKVAGFVMALMMALALSGCYGGVGPTEKAKKVTPSGYSEQVLETGRYWVWPWQSLIKIDTATNVANETIEDVYMKNKLMMTFDVQFRSRIDGNEKILNPMFSDIKPQGGEISWQRVYVTYGQRTVQEVSRRILSQYTTEEVLDNYGEVGKQLQNEITEAFKSQNNPLVVANVVLGKHVPPKGIIEAIAISEQKVAEIAQVEADREKDITKAKASKVVAQEEGEAKVVAANLEAEANRIIAASLTPELLQRQQIEAMKYFGAKGNATFIPYESMGNVGAQTRMYSK